jgi:hypothetical protein
MYVKALVYNVQYTHSVYWRSVIHWRYVCFQNQKKTRTLSTSIKKKGKQRPKNSQFSKKQIIDNDICPRLHEYVKSLQIVTNLDIVHPAQVLDIHHPVSCLVKFPAVQAT